MNRLHEENHILKFQLQLYRDSLQETELLLEKIQKSLDREQRQWLSALSSSQQECALLKVEVSKFSFQVEELKTAQAKGDQDLHVENEYLKVQLKEAIKKANESQRDTENENIKQTLIVRDKHRKDWQEGQDIAAQTDTRKYTEEQTVESTESLFLQCSGENKSVEGDVVSQTEQLDAHIDQLVERNKGLGDDGALFSSETHGYFEPKSKQTSNEIRDLKFHIKTLEKEFLRMQGKYYNLKRTHITLERKDDLNIPGNSQNIEVEDVRYVPCNEEVKDVRASKKVEDQRISSGLEGISVPLNEASNIRQSQEEASSRKLMTGKDATRGLQGLKVQNEDKEEEQEQMYAFYQIQIESLKQEIRSLSQKEVKDVVNKDKVDDSDGGDLQVIVTELKRKEDDIHRLIQVNERLKDKMKDTQETMAQKEEQYQSEIGRNNCETQRLLHVIKDLEEKIQRNIEEIESRKGKKEINSDINNETSEEVILLRNAEENMRRTDHLTSVMAPNGSSDYQREEGKVAATKDDGYSKVYANMENEISLLREHNFHLTRAFDDKEKELTAVRRTVARMEEATASFEVEIRTLRQRLDERKGVPMGNEHFIQLEEIIKELRKNNEDKQIEIEGRKVNESSLLKTLTEQMQKKAFHDDLLIKYEDLSGANTHLEYIIHDLKREISEKGSEIEDLKKEKASLMTKVISKDQDTSSEGDEVEDEIVTKQNQLYLSESEDVGSERNKLVEEIAGLRVELRSKEDQIESLRLKLLMQAGENDSLENKLAAKIRLIGCISGLIREEMRSEVNEPGVIGVVVTRSGCRLEEEDQEDPQMEELF